MVFTIEEIKNYLLKHNNIEDAITYLSEDAIVASIPVDAVDSFNYEKNDENLLKYEELIGMKKLKEEQQTLYRKSGGKVGRYWMACSPSWKGDGILDTKYKIAYWVNYGDDNTYGWFTVEQIKEWFENPSIKLYELGGLKER